MVKWTDDRGAVFIRDAANAAIAKALRKGEIRRAPCWVCGAERVEAHHPSYAADMRLAVVWLCRPHHLQVHAEARL